MDEDERKRMLDLIDKVELVTVDDGGPRGWVYFIVCADTWRCKIGFTKKEVEKRLANLQTGSPGQLVVAIKQPGTPETERRLHEKFAHCHVRGEWFELTDELRAYMMVSLWVMSEVTMRQGYKLEPWMVRGLEVSIDHLHTLPESLMELLEAEPAK